MIGDPEADKLENDVRDNAAECIEEDLYVRRKTKRKVIRLRPKTLITSHKRLVNESNLRVICLNLEANL